MFASVYLQVTLFFTPLALMLPCLSTTTCSNWRSNMSGVGPCATSLDFNFIVCFEARSRVRPVWLVLSWATYFAPVVCPISFRCVVVDGEVTIRVGQKEIFPVHRTVHQNVFSVALVHNHLIGDQRIQGVLRHEIGSGLGEGVLTNELSAGALCLARSTSATSNQAQIRIKVTPQEETAFSIP